LRFLFTSDGIPSPFGLRGWALDDFDLDPGIADPTDAPPLVPASGRLLVAAPGPNPLRHGARFALQVPAGAGPLRLGLYDARGRCVRRLLDGALAAGPHEVAWNGRGETGVALSSGVYYYRLESRLGVESGRLVLAH
jgi:hypothetical protein